MSNPEDLPMISYESMTVDLYAPLLVLMLTISSIFLLMSCSWSHLCDQYQHARQLASAEKENDPADPQDPTSLINR
jgi:cytochrome c-type biogenesis protein CcmH/NrfG